MFNRRALVAFVAACFGGLILATTMHAQSLGALAAAEKERRAAFALTPEGMRQAAIAAEAKAAEAKAAEAQKASLEKAAAEKAASEKAATAAKVAAEEKAGARRRQIIAQRKQGDLERNFSFWDGSHRGMTKLIEASLKNPASYEHVETTYFDLGDFLIVTTTYRATNGLGGVVPGSVTARFDLSGNLIEVTSQR